MGFIVCFFNGFDDYALGHCPRSDRATWHRHPLLSVGARVLVLGLAFKENCPDLRNTRVVDIVRELRLYQAEVDVHDPWVDAAQARHEYGIDLVASPETGSYDAIIIAVGHREFAALGADGLRAFGKTGAVLYDVKYILPLADVDGRL